MTLPSAETQLDFLFRIERLLSEGSFTATYKFALLLALADCAVERGDDVTDELVLDANDLAEKFIAVYWRQVLPWIGPDGRTGRLQQITGTSAAILTRLEDAHAASNGSLPRFRSTPGWRPLVRDVARVIEKMPLWKLQTIGRRHEDFLYPHVGKGRVIRLRGEAVYCFRQFHSLIGELVQSAWIRFIQRLPRNRPLLGHSHELREFLFGADRSALGRFCSVLVDHQAGRCFYCGKAVGKVPTVDHFIPWSRYPMDLGHNLVLADATCNADKADRLAAVSHLARWTERNADDSLIMRFEDAGLAHDRVVTVRVQEFAYRQAERTRSQVWVKGRDGLVVLDGSWTAASAAN
jgi:hypothetical protein